MLSSASREIVRSTLPAVGSAINEITPIFYRRMFAAHPELERDLFNRGNQAQGDQQRALASSIATFATLLVDDSVGDAAGLLARIAHKHASLGITPGQYHIVHEHLFAAIVEVLGEAVTPQVAAAWDEVYWEMARTLIDIEAGLYADAGVEAGDVWQDLVVRRRVQETKDTVSLVFADPDGAPLADGRPGQYVSVAVVLPDGARQIRQYSLTHCSAPGTLSISVRAVAPRTIREVEAPAGQVSNFLHDNVFEGDVVQVSRPFGEFELVEGSGPLILASAGIGITPMIGFLQHLQRTGSDRPLAVLHADRSPADHAHREELTELIEKLPGASLNRWYENLEDLAPADTVQEGFIDLARVDLPEGADLYLCGPLPFIAQVYRTAIERGVPDERVHFELFSPAKDLAAA